MRGIAVLALGIGFLVCGCPGPADTGCTGVAPAKLSDVQAATFTPTCATSGCHTGSLAAESLSLDEGKSFTSLVGRHAEEEPSMPLVTPGDPSKSYVYSQVTDGKMPQNGVSLTQAQIDQLRGWICAGAQND